MVTVNQRKCSISPPPPPSPLQQVPVLWQRQGFPLSETATGRDKPGSCDGKSLPAPHRPRQGSGETPGFFCTEGRTFTACHAPSPEAGQAGGRKSMHRGWQEPGRPANSRVAPAGAKSTRAGLGSAGRSSQQLRAAPGSGGHAHSQHTHPHPPGFACGHRHAP